MRNITALVVLVLSALGVVSFGASADAPKRVLVVMSNARLLPLKGGKARPTGYFLNELAIPAMKLADAGYELVFASPTGATPRPDPISDSPRHFASRAEYDRARRFLRSQVSLQHPQVLAQPLGDGLEQYAAVLVPGGHAPMVDLMKDGELAKILKHFHEHKKPTALICHGPVALLAAVREASDYQTEMAHGNLDRLAKLGADWFYRGYRVAVFSQAEEKLPVSFQVEDALRIAGATVDVGAPGKSHVVIDRELITAQNPASAGEFADALLAALARK